MARVVDRQDNTNGETENDDSIDQQMLLENNILQCINATFQSDVFITDSQINRNP